MESFGLVCLSRVNEIIKQVVRKKGKWPAEECWMVAPNAKLSRREGGGEGAVILICFFSEMQARSFSQSPVIKRYQQFLYFLLLCVSLFSLNKNFTLDKKKAHNQDRKCFEGFFFFNSCAELEEKPVQS